MSTMSQYKKIQKWTESKTYKYIAVFAFVNFILSICLNWNHVNILRFLSYLWLPLLLLYLLVHVITWMADDLQKMKEMQKQIE